ncbi:MAG: FlgD immunoglobulin-like domain containing protein [Candidatus Eisenbacteria bacterium]
MSRPGSGLLLLPLVAALILPAAASGRDASLYLITPSARSVSEEDAFREVREAGGRLRHTFADGGCIASLDSSGAEEVRARLPEGWELFSGPRPSPRTASQRVWNRLIRPAGERAKGAPTGRPLVGDALSPPLPESKGEPPRTYGPAGAGFWDGSEYLVGRVGVAVILVESDGSAEPSTEDWAEGEEAHVLASVGEAMDFWARQAPGGLLSFDYEFHARVPVSSEPIRKRQWEEGAWIGEALEHLGFDGGNRFQGAQSLANDLKERRGLDWAFAIFIVDSSEDEDGMFADGTFAYAYLGGPYMVLTLDNDGWGPENFASVCAHETGHIFYALDQYYAAHVPCNRASGYLGWETRNSQYGSCPENEPLCIMRSVPIGSATLSETARGQVGWSDGDKDGLPDVVDSPPAVEIVALAGEGTIRVEGKASAVPHPNRNPLGYGHAIAVDTIAAVEFRLDEGPWLEAVLFEGADRRSPRFVLEVSPPDSAEHRLLVRAVSSLGSVSTPACSLSILGKGKSLPAPPAVRGTEPVRLIGNRPNPFNPETEITIESDTRRSVRADVFDTRGVLVRRIFSGGVAEGRTVLRWDGRDQTGRAAPSGRYLCRVVCPSGASVLPMLLLR